MKVYYEIYGCAVMRGEAERVLSDLVENGFEVSNEEGDVALVFTCTVRSETEQRMIARIKELSRRYERVIVTGCLASAQPGLIKAFSPKAVVVSNGMMHRITEAILYGRNLLGYERPENWLKGPLGKFVTVIPIADGCLGNCTFCITKVARPVLKSQRPESVIRYALEAVERGSKEIWLTAPDAAAYGRDLGTNLANLLEELLENLPEGVKVRVGMMNPDTFEEIMDELMDIMKDERVFKFFHLPLQSASDKLLKLMGRKYTYDQYKSIVKEVRGKFGDPSIATDILVGFPNETDEDHLMTIEALKELKFERVHIAAYTPRPLTLAARMKQVSEMVKSRRVKEVYDVMIKVGEEVHRKYLDKIVEVFIDEYDEKHGTFVGRMNNYIPVVLENGKLGENAKAKITDYTFYDLRGYAIVS
ncbi:2-methylthioadenine synthetase [Ignicoccus islandicus DSM 13165]|uniref:tRNA-t(6)A37 methylthiotransferase n=1 Tax=Ignicoccus islandicus DSM 13165 TaxID=940295 RepID=A0A0U3FPN7_9CREN|nr:tRNA (N(6)-L-threonylcarbamoyladenosine(37)-C(2))-methylthiotransferase [Ignicoccus islandicus]ALU11424.1 2-methylthioadenine synthetase [Ignicoccus islandicus DSM 13165]